MATYTLIGQSGRLTVDDEARTIYLNGRTGGPVDGAVAHVDVTPGKHPKTFVRVEGQTFSLVTEVHVPDSFPERAQVFAAGVNTIAKGGKGGPEMVRQLTRRERLANLTPDEVAAENGDLLIKVIIFAAVVLAILIYGYWALHR